MLSKQLSPEEEAIGQIADSIIEAPMDNFLHNNYLPYAYYVIRNRALVGVDGLKPVQRRTLYSMWVNKNLPSASYTKAAKVASNTMGDYHPHGDQSISASLARMAQTFSMRVPLIDPMGSVGYFTGDTPAAARYWEARLTKAAVELLSELSENALPMGRNYTDELPEPALLPIRWPNILINGTEGIAVGYASKCFPHNPTEVMNAAIALVKKPDLTIDELLKIMPGPDFPTGGELLEAENMRENYLNGNGGFTLRARYRLHKLPRNRTQIDFFELPYQVSIKSVIAEINKLKNPEKKDAKGKKGNANKAPELTEITEAKELSDGQHGLQFSIILKAGANPDVVLEKLFSKTSLSKRFSLNNTVLEHGAPSQVSIFDLFEQFLDLRRRCISEALRTRLERLQKTLANTKGLATVLLDLDETIKIIRESEASDDAKVNLVKHFKISDSQADYVLALQLRRLTHSDREELIHKVDVLLEEINGIEKILSSKENLDAALIAQLESTREIIKDPRRTVINTQTADELKEEAKQVLIEEKAIQNNAKYTLSFFADGSVLKRLNDAETDSKKKKLPIVGQMQADINEQLYTVSRSGVGRKFPAKYIPFNQQVSKDFLELGHDFIAVGKQAESKADFGLLLVTSKGRVSIINGKYPTTMDEFPLLKLDDDETIVTAQWLSTADKKKTLFIASSSGHVTRFAIDTLRVSGTGSQPIKGMTLVDGAKVVASNVVSEGEGTIISTTSNIIKVTNLDDVPTKGRGTKGVILQKINEKTGDLKNAFASEGKNLLVTDKLGNSVALPPVTPRATIGLKFDPTGLVFGTNDNDISL